MNGTEERYLSQDLELFSPLVEVDEAVGHRVTDGRVYHRQIGQKRAQVRNRAVAYCLKDFVD